MLKVNVRLLFVIVLVGVLSLSGMVLAYDPNKSTEELIEETNWKIVATWEIDADGNILENGLSLVTVEWDGFWEITQRAGKYGATMVRVGDDREVNLYFDVHDDVLYDIPAGNIVLVTFEYLDEGLLGSVDIHFDTNDMKNSFDGNGVFGAVWMGIRRIGDNQWKTAQALLREARFASRQQGVADFRIYGQFTPFTVRKVTVAVAE